MKNLNVYLFLLSLTSSVSAASHQTSFPISEEGNNQLSTPRTSAPSVVSYTPSQESYATLAGGRTTKYTVPDISNLSTEEVIPSFLKLAGEYKKLLKMSKQTNANVTEYLQDQSRVLDTIPNVIDPAEAGESRSETLRNGIANLVGMHIELEAKHKELKAELESRKTSPDSNLTAELVAIKNERDALRGRVDEYARAQKADVTLADAHLTQLREQEKISLQLRKENYEQKTELELRNREISKLEKKISELQAESERRDQEITQLKKKISELQAESERRDQDLYQQSESSQSQTSAVAVLPRDTDRHDRALRYMQGRTQRSHGDAGQGWGISCSVM